MKILFLLFIAGCYNTGYTQSKWEWQNPYPTGSFEYASTYFFNHSTGFYIGEGLVLKTTNNGMSWNVNCINNPILNWLISIDFADERHGLLGGQDCIYRTTNQGESWELVYSPNSHIFGIQLINELTGYAVGRDILKTTDGGIHWVVKRSNQQDTDLYRKVFFIDEMTGWVTGDAENIKTTNGGENWFNFGAPYIALGSSVQFVNSSTGWAVSGGQIWKSVNGGIDWEAQYSGPYACGSLHFLNPNTGWASNCFTTDGGATWIEQGDPNCFHSVHFDSTMNGWGSIWVNNGIYRSSNGGLNWTNLTSGFRTNLNSCFFTSEVSGWAVGESGQIRHTSNAGENWILQSSPVSSNLRSVFFIDGNTGWAGGDELMQTADGGSSWQLVPEVSLSIYSIYFVSESTGLLGGWDKIMRTTDSGESWSEVYNNIGVQVRSICFSSVDTGWAVGLDGLILRTTNKGVDWTACTSPFVTALSAVHFPSVSTGYIVGNFGPGVIFKTTNAGQNWEWLSHTPFFNNDPTSIYFFNDNTGWISGNNGTLAKTTDGGLNWQTPFAGADKYLKSLFFVNDQTGWLVGSDGTILKTTNGGIEPMRIDLKMFVEGLYVPNSHSMIPDTVRIYLRNGNSPYNKIDSADAFVNSGGNCGVSFYRAESGHTYYVSIEHRNALETWSASRLEFNNTLLTLDFTINGEVAYGANQILIGDKYCFYSGDVNSDGIIDGSDLQLAENDAFQFQSGYLLSDVTGDDFTDGSDLQIIDDNTFRNVMVRRP